MTVRGADLTGSTWNIVLSPGFQYNWRITFDVGGSAISFAPCTWAANIFETTTLASIAAIAVTAGSSYLDFQLTAENSELLDDADHPEYAYGWKCVQTPSDTGIGPFLVVHGDVGTVKVA